MEQEESNAVLLRRAFDLLQRKVHDIHQRISYDCKEIPKEIVIAVYLVGSRLFGCHTEDSDFDLLAVVDDAVTSSKVTLASKVFKPQWSEDYGNRGPAGLLLLEEDDLNINIYHIRYFESLMQDNVVWIAMTFFSPPTATLYLRDSAHPVPFNLKKLNLKRVSLMDSEHNFLKAKKLMKENLIKKAKKNLVHGVRFLYLALQLCKPFYAKFR
jgi:predicted nucleotidyltransferase